MWANLEARRGQMLWDSDQKISLPPGDWMVVVYEKGALKEAAVVQGWQEIEAFKAKHWLHCDKAYAFPLGEDLKTAKGN